MEKRRERQRTWDSDGRESGIGALSISQKQEIIKIVSELKKIRAQKSSGGLQRAQIVIINWIEEQGEVRIIGIDATETVANAQWRNVDQQAKEQGAGTERNRKEGEFRQRERKEKTKRQRRSNRNYQRGNDEEILACETEVALSDPGIVWLSQRKV